MRVVVDAFGGDNAPLEVLKGCSLALNENYSDLIKILIVGDKEKIRRVAFENNIDITKLHIIDAPQTITMEDDADVVIDSKKQSSMAKGLECLTNGEGDVFISGGNSGALVVGCTFIVKRIKGIKRCAFAPIIPGAKKPFMLIDAGANVECRPSMLVQFGIMGSLYMKKIMKVENPKVALANIGTEECKGRSLQKEAFERLKVAPVNFTGNIEAREIPSSSADVVVTDGFTGNVILKVYEGTARVFMNKIKDILNKNFKNKIAALAILDDLKEIKKQTCQEEYAGSPVLGASRPVFKVHGNSKAKSFKNAIHLAVSYVNTNITEEIFSKI
ncbi:MAG: phosphate acyltransferase PlsX [Oscillospiraceae bacterium]|jgi:glycerol-3-phosphate acyltransferase PlsX|nr:phosphate acyltransferase PlsX [Oscillospiraceae bacterium]